MTTQPAKKATIAAASTSAVKSAKEVTLKAVESTRNATESAVNAGSEVIKELLTNGANEARRAQEKVLEMSRENAETFARTADAFFRNMSEAMNAEKGHMEAFVEAGNIAANAMKTSSSEALNFTSSLFSENVEFAKEFFACKSYNDFVEVSNRIFRSNVDAIFDQSQRLSDQWFKTATEVSEPLNAQFAEAYERLVQAFSSK